ncbi:proline-, glutamic acid- and leucine-rich protein 1-like [Crassostrea virginica]
MAASMENVMSQLLCDKNLPNGELVNLLRKINDTHFFQTKKSKLSEIVGPVHTFLNTSRDRVRGLLILSCLVSNCESKDLVQYIETWLRLIIQILQTRERVVVFKLTCRVCCQIIRVSAPLQTLRKPMLSFVPQLIPLLVSASPEWRKHSLSVLNACIIHYGGVCSPFKSKIEEVVSHALQQAPITKEAVLSFCLLSCCGSSGNQKIKYTEAWGSRLSHLLDDLHGILGHFDSEDGFSTDVQMSETDLAPPKEDHQVTFFRTLMVCLQRMLRKSFGATIKLPVEKILTFVDKVLALNVYAESLLHGYLPLLHTDAVNIINVLFESCRKLMLPYCKRIVQVLNRELLWSHANPGDRGSIHFRELREAVYRALQTMLMATGCFRETLSEEDSVLQELLADCKQRSQTMKSSLKPGNGMDPTPAKRMKMQDNPADVNKQPEEDYSTVTHSALQTLYWWIVASGVKMKGKNFQKICDFVVTTALCVYRNRCDPIMPYSDWRCRLHLLKVLQACIMTPHTEGPSPLQCAITIFKMAEQDNNLQVSSFSMEAQRLVEILVHSRAVCLTTPRYQSQEINTSAVVMTQRKTAPDTGASETSPPGQNDVTEEQTTQTAKNGKDSVVISDDEDEMDDSDSVMITEQLREEDGEVEGEGQCVVMDTPPSELQAVSPTQGLTSQWPGPTETQTDRQTEVADHKPSDSVSDKTPDCHKETEESAEDRAMSETEDYDPQSVNVECSDHCGEVSVIQCSTLEASSSNTDKFTDDSGNIKENPTQSPNVSPTEADDPQGKELEDILLTFVDVDPE